MGTKILAKIFLAASLFTVVVLTPPIYLWGSGSDSSSTGMPYIDDKWSAVGRSYTTNFAKTSNIVLKLVSGKTVITVEPDSIPVTDPVSTAGGFANIAESSQNISFNGDESMSLNPTANDPFVTGLGQWTSLPAMPRHSMSTRYMYIAHGGKKYVYCVFTGGDGKTFGRLDIEQGDLSREWEFLSPLPKPASDGCAIAYDGMYIYVARGCGSREIYRFEMPTVQNPIGKWYKMADVSSAVAKGAGMVNVGGTLYNVDGTVRAGGGSLYLLTGGGTTIFVKFAPSGNRDNLITEGQWSSVGTDLTAGFAESGSLVYPGGNFIYASRSTGGTGLFYKYNITANNWNGSAVIAPLPFYDSTPEQIASTSIQVKMDDYSMFSYPGRGKYIYLRAGQGDNNRTKFLRMDVSNDSWELLNDLPDEIGSLYATTYFADVTTLPSLRAKGDAIADSYTG
ncbi:MAG: hypothetical protein WCT15_02880, partial [Candidatus Omnitrophota bacterium]